MQSMDQQVLDSMCRWAREGCKFALITVARTWGSAPRPPGSIMALREDGRVVGSVSGGCVEDDLIAKVTREGFGPALPFLLTYGVTQDEAARFGLPCGGTIELMVEPCPDIGMLEALSDSVRRGELTNRTVVVGSRETVLDGARAGDKVVWDGRALTNVHGPAWRLLIVGAGQTSACLAMMAQALDYRVFVCDPRVEYTGGWDVTGTTLLSGMPDDAAAAFNLDPHSAVVALTHDPKLDDLVLLEALKSPAFYVGALGSRVNSQRRRERLVEHFDVTEEQMARLHGPVGLPIGSQTPPEIAVAILAEMTAVRNGAWHKDGLLRQRDRGS